MKNKKLFLILIFVVTVNLLPFVGAFTRFSPGDTPVKARTWSLGGITVNHACAQTALFKNPCVGKAEKWVCRSSEKGRAWVRSTDITAYKNIAGKNEMIVVSRIEGSSYATTMALVPETMKPIGVIVKGDTEMVCEAIYTGPFIAIRYKTFDKKKPFRTKKISDTPLTYDQATLFWLLRGYPFDKPVEIETDLVMPLGNRCSMKIRYLGKELITVPAGKFMAHKLEVEPDALLPIFSKNLKTYFWYSDEKIPKFLKYEYPKGKQVTELISATR
jgi:hypothetical protein